MVGDTKYKQKNSDIFFYLSYGIGKAKQERILKMGKAKIAGRGKQQELNRVPDEERWVVVGGPEAFQPGLPIYALSGTGLTKAEAEARAERLVTDTMVVPFLALGRHQRYSEELHRAYDEQMAAQAAESEEE